MIRILRRAELVVAYILDMLRIDFVSEKITQIFLASLSSEYVQFSRPLEQDPALEISCYIFADLIIFLVLRDKIEDENTNWVKQHRVASARSIDRHISRAWFIGDITGESDPGAGRHMIRV